MFQHLFKYFSLDPFAKIKMEKYTSQKKIIHDSFYQQISQTTNENKFLMNDMNKISPQAKIQKYINNLKQNPQPLRKIPMVSVSKTSSRKVPFLNNENLNSNRTALPSISTSHTSFFYINP